MSAGAYDYIQYRLRDLSDEIIRDSEIVDYPKNIKDIMLHGALLLRMTTIYLNRVDYLVSGDDGEDTFINRLKEELKEFEKEHPKFMFTDVEKELLNEDTIQSRHNQ